MRVAAHPFSRRAALGFAAAGVVVLTGCDILDEDSAAPPTPDPDTVLVDETVAEITAAAAVAAGVPELAAMHAAHLAALGATPSPSPSPTAPPPTAATPTGQQVRLAERDLQRYLVEAALRADAGPLARLLASMSAAVSQQLVALRPELR